MSKEASMSCCARLMGKLVSQTEHSHKRIQEARALQDLWGKVFPKPNLPSRV